MSSEAYTPLELESPATDQRTGYYTDTRYLRSAEGIVRILSLPFAVIGLVLSILGFQGGLGGLYYSAAGNFIGYIVVVFILEVFVPRIFVHRLVDASLTFFHAVLWLGSAILATLSAAVDYRNNGSLLGVAAVFAYVCTVFGVVSSGLAAHTWRSYGRGRVGSRPLFGA